MRAAHLRALEYDTRLVLVGRRCLHFSSRNLVKSCSIAFLRILWELALQRSVHMLHIPALRSEHVPAASMRFLVIVEHLLLIQRPLQIVAVVLLHTV